MKSSQQDRKKKHPTRRALVTLALMLALVAQTAVAAFAQNETGTLTGTVKDPQGAVVAGANVIVKSVDSGTERRSVTTDAGTYTVSYLQPGVYDVSVEAQGFGTRTQRAQITVGAKLSLDFDLSLQTTSEQVNVVAGESGVAVNTETQQLANTVSERQIVELPTLTRNPYALVQLAGNVSPGDEGDLTGAASRGA